MRRDYIAFTFIGGVGFAEVSAAIDLERQRLPRVVRVRYAGEAKPWRDRDPRDLFADARGSLGLLPALKKHDPAGRWWMSARGALERPATIYECLHPAFSPREGWRLVDGAARVAELKQLPRGIKSELEEDEEAAFVAKAKGKLERNFDKVRAKIATHAREASRHATLRDKWMGKLRALERHRAAREVAS